VHIYYDQIGFVLDLWLKFLLRSCDEDPAAVVRERSIFVKFKHTSLKKSNT